MSFAPAARSTMALAVSSGATLVLVALALTVPSGAQAAARFRPVAGVVELVHPGYRASLIYGTNDPRNHFQRDGKGLYADGAGPNKIYVHRDCLPILQKAAVLLARRNVAAHSDLRFVVFDALRPCAIQRKMFEQVPNPTYVARCEVGRSVGGHNRGMAIDLSLESASTGAELDMGSAFDEFSEKSRVGADVSPEARANRGLLREAMLGAGMKEYLGEWWHFACPISAGKSAADYKTQP